MSNKFKSIRVTVQREDRLRAITELSIAIGAVAKALSQSAIVNVSNCAVEAKNGTGIKIDTADDINKTLVLEED